jgi:hypothetical protein
MGFGLSIGDVAKFKCVLNEKVEKMRYLKLLNKCFIA